MLAFLKLRVVVDNAEIYLLEKKEPVVISVKDDHPKIVITDGFHYTKPLELFYREPSYYNFKIKCSIDDLKLLGGLFVVIVFFLFGSVTGFIWLKLASFMPIFYFLYLFYINRKGFLQITQE
ncbi:MAG: hypothetical protein ABUT20_10850 [Bacteroidota bacterium]